MNNHSLNNILDGIESKLKYRTNPKVLDSKITADLNYYKESMQKTYESKLINDKFLPGDYDKFDQKHDKKPYLSSASNSNLNMTSEFEIRKIMEREMEPYIYSAKNELKLVIDGFMKDLGDYKYIKNELNLVKDTVQDNKRLVLVFQEDFEKKFIEYTQKILNVNKQFEDIKLNFNDFTKRIKNFEKLYENLQEKTFYIETIKDKVSNFETNNEKIYKTLEDNINLSYSNRFKNIESNIENLKSSGNNLNNTISNLTINYNSLQNLTNELSESNNVFMEELNEIKEKYNNLNLNANTLGSKCENALKYIDNLDEKCAVLGKNYKNLNANFGDLCNEFDQLNEKVESNKNTQGEVKNDLEIIKENLLKNSEKIEKTEKNAEKLQNSIQNSIQNSLNSLSTTNKNIEDRITKQESKINELQLQIQNNSIANNTNQNNSSNPVYDKSITELVKQSMHLTKEVTSIKEEQTRFEENFEAIQENFEKINLNMSENIEKTSQMEKSQNLINEIIKTMTLNNEGFKRNVELQFGNLEKWKEALIDNLKKNYGEMKMDLEMKINTSLNEGANSSRGGVKRENINNNSNSNIPFAYEEKISLINKKISEIERNIELIAGLVNKTASIDTNQINQKISENEEKIGKIFHYFEPKIEEIVECINLICSKYDLNLNLPVKDNNQNFNPNPNNMTNSNILMQNSNIEKSNTMHYLPIYPSCYVSNTNTATDNLVLKGGVIISQSLVDNSPAEHTIRSKLNTIEESTTTNNKSASTLTKKFKANLLYLSTNPLNFQEVQSELKGYLKKYLFFQKQYENVIEVDFDLNQEDNSTNNNNNNNDNDNEFGQENIGNNPMERLSKSSGKILEAREKRDELQAVDFNDDIFCEDLDDFDRDSEGDEIHDIIYRNEEEQRRDKEVKSRTLKNLLSENDNK